MRRATHHATGTGARPVFPILVLAIAALAATADAGTTRAPERMGIEVATLHYRDAQEVLALIRPLLPAGAAVSGHGRQILIRAAPAERKRIRALLERVDTPPRRLLILVRRRPSTAPPGATVIYRVGGPEGPEGLGGRIYRTGSEAGPETVQQVQVLEGRPAYLEIGAAVPVADGGVWITGATIGSTPGLLTPLRYREMTAGFEVLARTDGDHVILTLRAHRERPAETGGGVIDLERIRTTVRGLLGRWIDLGGASRPARRASATRVYATRDLDATLRGIQIKVVALPPASVRRLR
ncbi:MAG TPA: hypothetical protein ENH08_03890 [Chromatiales bacterium]|nr:hypothetical protein [Chromatiales bacterium]